MPVHLKNSRSIFSLLWRILRIPVFVYVGILGFYAVFQRDLIYFPLREAEASYAATAKTLGLEPWLASDGTRQGWVRRNPATTMRAVVFHGNAGNALDRWYYVQGLSGRTDEHGWEVYLFEYPGYGSRQGRPSQTAFVEAASSAVKDLAHALDSIPVVLVGESLGSGVAAQVTTRVPEVAGLFFITPFHSLAGVGRMHFPWLPVGILLRDTYRSGEALEDFNGPLAVLLAGRDVTVPTAAGQKLFESYNGRKMRWIQPEAGHNDLDVSPDAPWWGEVREFLSGDAGQ